MSNVGAKADGTGCVRYPFIDLGETPLERASTFGDAPKAVCSAYANGVGWAKSSRPTVGFAGTERSANSGTRFTARAVARWPVKR